MASDLRRARDEQRKERRRGELLSVAAALFVRKGYHATIISDIAAEARVGQGTVYRYFKDKRDILDHLFEELVHKVFEQFSEMTSRPPSNEAEYRAASVEALRKVVNVLDGERDLVHLIIREGPSIDREFGEKLAGLYERLAMLARYYLDNAIAGGFARQCDSKIVSQALIGIGVWMANLWCTGRLGDETPERVLSEIVDLAFEGFGQSGNANSLAGTHGHNNGGFD